MFVIRYCFYRVGMAGLCESFTFVLPFVMSIGCCWNSLKLSCLLFLFVIFSVWCVIVGVGYVRHVSVPWRGSDRSLPAAGTRIQDGMSSGVSSQYLWSHETMWVNSNHWWIMMMKMNSDKRDVYNLATHYVSHWHFTMNNNYGIYSHICLHCILTTLGKCILFIFLCS